MIAEVIARQLSLSSRFCTKERSILSVSIDRLLR
jgi:hypothetical protein